MDNKLRRFQKVTFVLGVATVTLLCLPCPTHAQSPQDRQTVQGDDITRRDVARFDQFLDSHREIADELRKTPSLIDDPQFLQRHPELNAYLQDHPSVKQEISQHPDTFMSLEDRYDRDRNLRDRDAGGQDRDADRRDVTNRDNDRGDEAKRDDDRRDVTNRADRRDVANFDRFLDEHREIAEQVRKDPSLLDNRSFVRDHPALQTYLQDNPGVRDQLRQDPNAFMRQEDAYDRDPNMRDRDAGGPDRDADRRDVTNRDNDRGDVANRDADRRDQAQRNDDRRDVTNRDNDRRDVASFDRFLDGHREIAEQVRKDPSLLDNRNFVQNHPALQTYIQDNPGVRDQLRQDPNAFMRQEDAYDRDSNGRDRDPMHDHMADFGGFLHSHSDVQKDLSRDPSVVKNHDYVQNHAELDAYLNAHPDMRTELMANPQSFVRGAQQYNANPSGTSGGAGLNGSGTGKTGSATGTSTNPPKPNQ